MNYEKTNNKIPKTYTIFGLKCTKDDSHGIEWIGENKWIPNIFAIFLYQNKDVTVFMRLWKGLPIICDLQNNQFHQYWSKVS
jgi:hypothetical protein